MKIIGWIRLGDKAACGGTVIEGEPRSTYNGIPFAFQGAKLDCSQKCVVVEAAKIFTLPNGRKVPHHGHRTSGGCPLLSTANDKSGYSNASGKDIPEHFVQDANGNWLGCGAAMNTGDTNHCSNSSAAQTGQQVIEQYFALLGEDGRPVDGYHYDLHANEQLHVKGAPVHDGKTMPVGGASDVTMVAWLVPDRASKNG